MKELIVLVGPAGSGKSTLAKEYENNGYIRISQDDQGRDQHFKLFSDAILNNQNIVIDRMNFNKQQRSRYLEPAKAAGYKTKIIVLHENSKTCLKRILKRENHPTVNGIERSYTVNDETGYVGEIVNQELKEQQAKSALHTFFKGYERPQEGEADAIEFRYPEGIKRKCIVSDIDNTLANADHREHHVNTEGKKKDWKSFFEAMGEDTVNEWCKNIINAYSENHIAETILVSARPDNYRKITESWLMHNDVIYDELIMRARDDFRKDDVVKEQIFDFEIKTRYEILFWIDDRKQVIDKIRSRGVTVLDCAGEKGNF